MVNKRRNGNGESGQGIAYVLVICAALLVFVIAIVDVIRNESRFIVKQTRAQRFIHAEDGAADRAMYALLKGGNWDALPSGAVTGYQQDAVYTDVQGMKYTLKVQEGNWTPGYMIGDQDAERTITVFATMSPTGEHKKLQVVVIKSTLASALFSGGVISIGGNVTVHWGPVVSYATIDDCIPMASIPTTAIYLAKGGITIGGCMAENCSPPLDSSDPQASLSVDSHSTSIGTEPVVPLDLYKQAAMQQNQDSSSSLFYIADGTCQPTFAIPSPIGKPEDMVVFYDTTDTLKWDSGICGGGGNGVDVKKTGNKFGTGKLIVMGDLDVKGTGQGSPMMYPPVDCQPRYAPVSANDCVAFADGQIFWDGFVYIANELKGAGNVKVYGTLYAKSTANLTGHVTIWYKSTNNQLGELGKTVNIKLWKPRPPQAGDVFPP